MQSVFISFSSRDESDIAPITEMMDKNNISYFKAPQSIPAGSNYAKEIPKAIKECEVFLLIITGNAQRSIWVEKEIDCAINNRKNIIPIKLTNIPLSDMFKFYLNNVQIIMWYENPRTSLRQLEIRLQMLVGAEQITETVTEKTKTVEQTDISSKPSGVEEEIMMLRKKQQGNGVRTYSDKQRSGTRPNPFLEDEIRRKTGGLSPHRVMARRQNAISVNKIPEVCEQCGGDLIEIHGGTYRCESCGYINMDSFGKIKNYLAENGAKPVLSISEATGVSREAVEYFFLEEHLEIPRSSGVTLKCKQCGAPIRTGTICDECKYPSAKKTNNVVKPKYHFVSTDKKDRR